MFLIDFEVLRPPFESNQEEALSWIASVHTAAELARVPDLDEEAFFRQMKARILKVGGRSGKLGKRATCLSDMIHRDWDRMHLFNVKKKIGFGEKGRIFAHLVDGIFETFYSSEHHPPDDLIHVTCTGYHAPSGAQKIVLKKGWERKTTVTHAYHMGCYGAMPAIRMASGFAAYGKKKIDIVHTELCTLHLNPQMHEDEQLVAQSLFADGLIKYSLVSDKPSQQGFKLLAVYEELLPDTDKEMGWVCEDWGLKMTLSKRIPQFLEEAIVPFVSTLETKSKCSFKNAFFAIHPGGPKIISLIQKKLQLEPYQIAASEKILFSYGNMSSATLPHIWENLLHDETCQSGQKIVGLAFGPGLCMCGIVLEKI